MPDRYYLTTAIAYANNKPGLHTLYEVIGADAIARWHRMLGDETRFLTGTDEHSVNIAQQAASEGRSPREFVDEKVELFKAAEAALGITPDRFIRTTDPDHVRSAQEMVRRAYANGDIYLGTYEGWYCPNEGFKAASDVIETAQGVQCPNHPNVPLQWLSERNWFFRLSAYQDRLLRHFEEHPDFVEPDYRRNEMLGFIRQGLEDFSISRAGATWGIPFPVAENGESSQREDGSWDPEAGTIYVWYDALINYITGAGFPDDPDAFAKWWPADLHVIGKDINRFHTIYWPAMLWSAGLEAPRKVWVHGWLLAKGGERMSKSRGNFLDPADAVAAFGSDGARYVTLREVAFDRDTEVSWDSFVRRYNADLANDFGNLVNRTVTMAGRYLGGERPPASPDSPLAAEWSSALSAYRDRFGRFLLDEALAALWEFVGAANRYVDGEQPWVLAKGGKGRRRGRRGTAARRPRRPRRGVPADRTGGSAVHPRDRAAGVRSARPHVSVRARRQRRTSTPGRTAVGRTRGGTGNAWDARAALSAAGIRGAGRRPRRRRGFSSGRTGPCASRIPPPPPGGIPPQRTSFWSSPARDRRASNRTCSSAEAGTCARRARRPRPSVIRGSTHRPACIPTMPPPSTRPGGARSSGWQATRGWSRSARPASTSIARSHPSRCRSRTCVETSRWPSRPPSQPSCTADRGPANVMRRTCCFLNSREPGWGRSPGCPPSERAYPPSSTRSLVPSTTLVTSLPWALAFRSAAWSSGRTKSRAQTSPRWFQASGC